MPKITTEELGPNTVTSDKLARSISVPVLEASTTLKLAGTAITDTAAELNLLDNQPALCGFSAAQSATVNGVDVTITVNDAAGVAMGKAVLVDVWFSDDADGVGLAAQPDSIAVKANSGTQMAILTANKALLCQTKANGTLIITMVDAGQTGMFIAARPHGTHFTSVGTVATGDYKD